MLRAPNKVTLFVTRQCNLNCKHCFSEAGKFWENQLTLLQIEKLSNDLEEIGIFQLTISGGEPFVRPDILDILTILCKKNFDVVVASNGTLINNRIADFFAKTQLPIQISIDSENGTLHDKFRQTAGAFEKAIKGIKKLSYKGADFSLGVTITTYNYHKLDKIVRLAKRLGARGVYFMFFVPVGRGAYEQSLDSICNNYTEVISNLIEIKEKESKMWIAFSAQFPIGDSYSSYYKGMRFGLCEAGISRCAIDTNGDVYPCQLLMKEEFKAGNICNEHIYDIWGQSKIFQYLRNLSPNDLNGDCIHCKNKSICRGGCRGAAFQTYGDILAPDPRCPIICAERNRNGQK